MTEIFKAELVETLRELNHKAFIKEREEEILTALRAKFYQSEPHNLNKNNMNGVFHA